MGGMPIARSAKSVVLALAVSGTSLAAFLYLGLSGFEPEANAAGLTALEFDELEPAVYAAPKFTIPDEVQVETPRVTVPDISGENVEVARMMLRESNLVLVAVEDGQPIDPFETDNYYVSPKQQFGQEVWAGTRVEVEVNYRAPKTKKFAMGY